MVDRQDAVVERRQDRVGAGAVAGQLGDALLLLVRRVVDDAHQLTQLVVAPHLDARREVPAGELVGGLHDLPERAPERARRAPATAGP